jgi:3-mercaptopropionate dioxygenase
VPRGGIEHLHAVETIEAHPGHVEALVPPLENIHCVEAGGRGLTISIHVYGADIERLGSSVYRTFDDLDALPVAA